MTKARHYAIDDIARHLIALDDLCHQDDLADCLSLFLLGTEQKFPGVALADLIAAFDRIGEMLEQGTRQ